MSLIARIQFVNFLTYSNPDSRDRKPALRVVEFWPLKYSTAINIPNGHGKTNMITVLLYLLSRDSKLKELALSLFTPRRCGAPSHIRVQLWDVPDELARRDLTADEGLLDPSQLPNNNDHYVFGLCAYHGEEPRFYYYRGTLDDCDVFRRTDTGYIYHQEADVQQGVKRIGGAWNIASAHEWRSLVTSHIPGRVLAQQVKFHLAGGGDKSAPLQQVEQDEEETFDQAFFRTVIAPELLAFTGELDSDPADPRESFEDELYAHFSKLASASLRAEQEKQALEQQVNVVHDLGTLVAAGDKARQGLASYQELVDRVARDGALIRHLVINAPFPGLLGRRAPPHEQTAQLLPYLTIDRLHGVLILDSGIAKLVSAETRRVNEVAVRKSLPSHEVDESQVIDFACDLKISGASGWGGARVAPKGYLMDTSLQLAELLSAGDTRTARAAREALRQAFAWMDDVGDTNTYRRQTSILKQKIRQLREDVRQQEHEILCAEAEARELRDKIGRYDQAKGAFADLVGSGAFTEQELATPGVLGEQVTNELRDVEELLATHAKRVGSLEQIHAEYKAFVESHPEVSPRERLAELSGKWQASCQALQDAEERVQQSREAATLASSQADARRYDVQAGQQQLDVLLELQSHQCTYRTWFGDIAPASIDIPAGLTRIASQEQALARRHRMWQSLREELGAVLPAVPGYHALFPETDAESLDIHGALVRIAERERALATRHSAAHALDQRLSCLAPFVSTFRSIFGETDPLSLDPVQERTELQNAITLTETGIGTLEQEVALLQAFHARHPGQSAAAWLAGMETRRTTLTQDVIQCQHRVQTARRQLAELHSDPVAKTEDAAAAHRLIDGAVPYVPLHLFIHESCPRQVREHWLTHFSALLFSPVVQTVEEAATAARLLYDGQTMMPVLLADRLRLMMESGEPSLALDGECAYTWVAGFKTRMVHCLLDPSAVNQERRLAEERLAQCRTGLERQQRALDALSEQSEQVQLARGAARAEASDAVTKLAAEQAELTRLRQQLPGVLRRSAPDALESIARTREDHELIKEHGVAIRMRIAAELEHIDAESTGLKASRAWHEARNTDEVRAVIGAMRRYQSLLREHGNDVLSRADEELRQIADAQGTLQRERTWYEERNSDDARIAVSAMRRYRIAGGDEEAGRLQRTVQEGMEQLEALGRQLHDATDALTTSDAQLTTARNNAREAEAACHQSERYLKELAGFAESDDLPFMQSHAKNGTTLADERLRAQTRKSYDSQFLHAQRYVELKDSNVGEHELLHQVVQADARVALARSQLTQATDAIEEKREQQATLGQFGEALHDAACRILAEFRAVAGIMDDIGAVSKDTPRFDNTGLYACAEALRSRLDRAEDEPFLLEDIRKVGRLASELGLAVQAREIARTRRESDRHTASYAEHKTQFCRDIVDGRRKGLSVLTAEWLRDQKDFNAPQVLRARIEEEITKRRELLTQATASLDDIRDKTSKVLTVLARDAQRALAILDEAMNTTSQARFYVNADVISANSINALLDRLYGAIEARRSAHPDMTTTARKRHRKSDLEYLRSEIYRSLFANVSVEFRHPSIWEGEKTRLRSKDLSEGMRTAISLMWVAKLAEFRLRQAIDQAGGMRRQNRAALRKERYFIILDGLFSSLSHDELIDSAMESLRASAGHFQLIGMIHHPRYINNARIFPAYFVGRPFKATSGKHAWLTVDRQRDVPGSLGVFGVHHTQ